MQTITQPRAARKAASDPLENAASCILREWLSELQREYQLRDCAGRKRMARELAVLNRD